MLQGFVFDDRLKHTMHALLAIMHPVLLEIRKFESSSFNISFMVSSFEHLKVTMLKQCDSRNWRKSIKAAVTTVATKYINEAHVSSGYVVV